MRGRPTAGKEDLIAAGVGEDGRRLVGPDTAGYIRACVDAHAWDKVNAMQAWNINPSKPLKWGNGIESTSRPACWPGTDRVPAFTKIYALELQWSYGPDSRSVTPARKPR